jgi:hypothetical protein
MGGGTGNHRQSQVNCTNLHESEETKRRQKAPGTACSDVAQLLNLKGNHTLHLKSSASEKFCMVKKHRAQGLETLLSGDGRKHGKFSRLKTQNEKVAQEREQEK